MSAAPTRPMTDSEQSFVLFLWEDNCKLVAAGKMQRWDVVKWVVSVNLALASASAISGKSQLAFCALAVIVAVLGAILVSHYNLRMTVTCH
jgi:hypothetical protein